MRAKRSSPTPPLLVALPLSLALSLRYRGARACASLAQFLARHTGRLPVAPIVARAVPDAPPPPDRVLALACAYVALRAAVALARWALARRRLASEPRAPPHDESGDLDEMVAPRDGLVEVPDDGAADGGSAARRNDLAS